MNDLLVLFQAAGPTLDMCLTTDPQGFQRYETEPGTCTVVKVQTWLSAQPTALGRDTVQDPLAAQSSSRQQPVTAQLCDADPATLPSSPPAHLEEEGDAAYDRQSHLIRHASNNSSFGFASSSEPDEPMEERGPPVSSSPPSPASPAGPDSRRLSNVRDLINMFSAPAASEDAVVGSARSLVLKPLAVSDAGVSSGYSGCRGSDDRPPGASLVNNTSTAARFGSEKSFASQNCRMAHPTPLMTSTEPQEAGVRGLPSSTSPSVSFMRDDQFVQRQTPEDALRACFAAFVLRDWDVRLTDLQLMVGGHGAVIASQIVLPVIFACMQSTLDCPGLFSSRLSLVK